MQGKPYRGYAGLIGVLVIAAIIALLTWRPDLFSGDHKTATSTPTSPLAPTTPIERGIDAVDSARATKDRLERNSAEQQQAIDN